MAKKRRDIIEENKIRVNNLKMENPFVAKTDGHKEYVRAIVENDYVLVQGMPGTGKSYTACGMASQYLVREQVEEIVLVRPMVQTGLKALGILPGNVDEKYGCYLMPLFEHLEFFLGKGQTRQLMRENRIRSVPLEIAKGLNFHNSFVIVDEAQNCDYSQLSMIMCRLCAGSKIIINGDVKQCDLKSCDFEIVMNKLENLHGVACVKLTEADIMRSGMIAKILRRLE